MLNISNRDFHNIPSVNDPFLFSRGWLKHSHPHANTALRVASERGFLVLAHKKNSDMMAGGLK